MNFISNYTTIFWGDTIFYDTISVIAHASSNWVGSLWCHPSIEVEGRVKILCLIREEGANEWYSKPGNQVRKKPWHFQQGLWSGNVTRRGEALHGDFSLTSATGVITWCSSTSGRNWNVKSSSIVRSGLSPSQDHICFEEANEYLILRIL